MKNNQRVFGNYITELPRKQPFSQSLAQCAGIFLKMTSLQKGETLL
jgi:hypothetical protein